MFNSQPLKPPCCNSLNNNINTVTKQATFIKTNINNLHSSVIIAYDLKTMQPCIIDAHPILKQNLTSYQLLDLLLKNNRPAYKENSLLKNYKTFDNDRVLHDYCIKNKLTIINELGQQGGKKLLGFSI